MSISLKHVPKGRTFVRSFIMNANGMMGDRLHEVVEQRWGASEIDRVEKAAVAALEFHGTDDAATEFLDAVVEQTVIGRMGLRRIPFNVRMTSVAAGATGYWVGEAAPKPISKPTLEGSTLRHNKVSSIIVLTDEAVKGYGPTVDAGLQRDLERAVVLTLDQAFIDPANIGTPDVMPAAVTAGAPTIASTGNIRTDLAAAVDAFAGDLSSASWVTDPTTATELAMAPDANGNFLFPDAGPRGGTLLGLPLIVSRVSPRDSSGGQIALIDGSAIVLGLDSVTLDSSKEATLSMRDDPSDETTNVSLFQTNSTAVRAEVGANWSVERAGAVVVITGATYASA